jgi:hypothetical protein
MHRNVSTADSRYVFFVSISALAIYSQAWPLRGAEHQTAPAKKAPRKLQLKRHNFRLLTGWGTKRSRQFASFMSTTRPLRSKRASSRRRR